MSYVSFAFRPLKLSLAGKKYLLILYFKLLHYNLLYDFLERCPKEMSSHIQTIIKLCLKYITYDPNYNYDAEDDQDDGMDVEDKDDEDQGNVCLHHFFSGCHGKFIILFRNLFYRVR